MNKKNLNILTNIIGAVESGGQVYGNRNYSAYAGAYKNSPNEHTCTLGWAQNCGYNAMNLCKLIFQKSPSEFRKADTANIEAKLNVDWVATRWNPNSAEQKALIAIITTDTGKKIQDELFEETAKKYINEALAYDKTMSVQAQMMWCEIQHLGGLSAAQRIFNKAKKPYTVDSIFDALMSDQSDMSSSNQVGDKKYQSRHECCVRWIKQYVPEKNMTQNAPDQSNDVVQKTQEVSTMTEQKAIEALINTAKNEIGYLEKKSNSQLDSKTANAGSNNYTKYWRDIASWGLGNYQAQYWCAAFVYWCFRMTFGRDTAKALLYHEPFIYCPTAGSLFKQHNRLFADPKVGDVVLFMKSGGVFGHTGIVYKVDNTNFYTIEGNTSSASGVVANGGGVAYKQYNRASSKSAGHRFCRPDYSLVKSVNNVPVTVEKDYLSLGDSGKEVKEMQKMLIALGYDLGSYGADGDFGKATDVALRKFQADCKLTVDGQYGAKTKKKLTNKYNKKTATKETELHEEGKWVGIVTADSLNVRTWAGTENPTCSFSPLKYGTEVDVCDSKEDRDGKEWYYIKYNNKHGFVSSSYVKKK